MVTLYRNYTVSVQDSTTFEPDNDLELLLFEGKIEIKVNPTTGKKDVYNYGTTTLATEVFDKNGIPCSALVADETERPGEYDFTNIDLNKAGSLSFYGETLYSVVARPDNYDPSDEFANAKIIVDSTDLSDSNVKQLVKASIGGTSSIVDNIMVAGGSVTFNQYTNGVVNSNTKQYLEITDLPSEITSLTETATSYPTHATATKLCMRFNVYYSDGTDAIRWESVPCDKTSDNSWVIMLQQDQYNVYRTQAFGVLLDLGAIFQNFIVAVDPASNNVHIRRFDTNPTITLPTTGSTFERTLIHTHMVGNEPVVGVGAWTYATASLTPYYNLDVLGTRGMRVTISGREALLLSTSSKLAYDGTSYFGVSASALIGWFGSSYRFVSSSTSTILGHGFSAVPTQPVVIGTSTDIKLQGTTTTYLQANSSNQIYAYRGGNLTIAIDSAQTTVKYASSYTLSLNASSTYLQGATSGQYSLYVTPSLSVFGHNFTVAYTQPLAVATSTYLRLQGTLTTYFSATSSNQLYAYQGSNQAMAIDSTQSMLAFTTGGITIYTFKLQTLNAYLASASGYQFYTTTGLTAVGNNITASPTTPAFVGLSTYARLQGTVNTYIQCHDITHASPNEIWANVLDTSSKRSIWLRAGDYRFGYYVTNTTGVYFNAGVNTLSGVLNNYPLFYGDASEFYCGPNADNKITISTTPSYVVRNGGKTIIYATSAYLKLYSPIS
ncbi:MAG: hypothetical protein EHM14_15910, partial [Methanothrix sp.]